MINFQKLGSNFIVHEGQSFNDFLDDGYIIQTPGKEIIYLMLESGSLDDILSLGFLDSMLMDAVQYEDILVMKDSFDNSLYTVKIEKNLEKPKCNKIDLDDYGVTNFLKDRKRILCHSHEYINRTTAFFDLMGKLEWKINIDVIGGKEVGELIVLRVMHNYRNVCIEGRSVKDGSLRWSLDEVDWPVEGFEISGLFTYKEKLLLLSKKVNAIILVDVTVGQIFRVWDTLPNNITYGPYNDNVIPNLTQSVLSQSANMLMGMAGRYYWEIDLETGMLDFQDFTDVFNKMEIDAKGIPSCEGDHLFFASDAICEESHLSTKNIIKLVAFNWCTRQVDWEYTFDHPGEGFYQVKPPKVKGDYLVTVDSNNLLHIFKRNG